MITSKIKSMWLDSEITVYKNHSDNTGKPGTCRDALTSPISKEISDLRELEKDYHDDFGIDETDYRTKKALLKKKIPCWAPAALLESRARDNVKIISRTGLMQFDYDYNDIWEYDIEEAKQKIFNLSFVCYCGLSCSGKGFFALVLIAEPERLKEYAEHCFEVFSNISIKVDTSKGRNVTDLRYFSYDEKALIRENPKPLRIKHFIQPAALKTFAYNYSPPGTLSGSTGLLNSELLKIEKVQIGHRWQTVQQVSFTLGGLNDYSLLELIKHAIKGNGAFSGEERKYLKCAKDCFNAGTQKPLHETAAETFAEITAN